VPDGEIPSGIGKEAERSSRSYCGARRLAACTQETAHHWSRAADHRKTVLPRRQARGYREVLGRKSGLIFEARGPCAVQFKGRMFGFPHSQRRRGGRRRKRCRNNTLDVGELPGAFDDNPLIRKTSGW